MPTVLIKWGHLDTETDTRGWWCRALNTPRMRDGTGCEVNPPPSPAQGCSLTLALLSRGGHTEKSGLWAPTVLICPGPRASRDAGLAAPTRKTLGTPGERPPCQSVVTSHMSLSSSVAALPHRWVTPVSSTPRGPHGAQCTWDGMRVEPGLAHAGLKTGHLHAG